jgi:ABC-2 type transport system ATP-binding protein
MTTPLPEFAIDARALRKTYRAQGKAQAKEALKGIDLKVPRGSIFGLLGPNGAGKSTFINTLAGLVTKTSGTVSVWGYDIDKSPREAKSAIGVVPQELNFDAFFTPFEALELQAGYYGVPKAERRSEEILAAVGLLDKRDAYARTLSGGMKRRLLVAKALVHAPPVLILDEPTAGVDVELRRQLWDYVRELHAKGTTIVLTTHYLEEAQELCDTIAIINHGQVVACEPTPQLLRRLDKKTLVVTPASPVADPGAALKGLEVKVRKDGALAISYRSGVQSVEDLLGRLRTAGIGIKDLATEEPDLEDVFVSLTS